MADQYDILLSEPAEKNPYGASLMKHGVNLEWTIHLFNFSVDFNEELVYILKSPVFPKVL